MRNDSYESILRAVGRVLDHAGARGFAMRETDDGLHVEALDGEGQSQFVVQLGLHDLVELMEWSGIQDESPRLARTITADEGTLAHFRERRSREAVRELVGTRS
jgi:hypothetical protein